MFFFINHLTSCVKGQEAQRPATPRGGETPGRKVSLPPVRVPGAPALLSQTTPPHRPSGMELLKYAIRNE